MARPAAAFIITQCVGTWRNKCSTVFCILSYAIQLYFILSYSILFLSVHFANFILLYDFAWFRIVTIYLVKIYTFGEDGISRNNNLFRQITEFVSPLYFAEFSRNGIPLDTLGNLRTECVLNDKPNNNKKASGLT